MEQTRSLFFLCSLASLPLTVPVAVAGEGRQPLLALAAAAVLVCSWTRRHRSRRAPVVLDAVDVLAVTAFATAASVPAVVFGIIFTSLWYRAVYGGAAQWTAYCAGVVLSPVAAVLLWPHLPGREDAAIDAGGTLGALPVIVLSMVVARHLASGQVARERARRRDAALTALSTRLLGLTDRDRIVELGWAAAAALCAATPGLRVLVVVGDGDRWRVTGSAGAFHRVPATLPG
ncbi:hypothetical protein [Geodermatophilus sp. DSM 44513]|uniref:hypothetical protein n=1 Tax=Geodermatophilus sp. DSM 44513 TaxID=1528104 RepID=UPI0014124086|nr:hypothetical protein [Geodermatophilus sp. DSM 44513]WNV77543.1 hypothetical protein RTG05_09760 [Geodermatophilus sp. DSM 44513]